MLKRARISRGDDLGGSMKQQESFRAHGAERQIARTRSRLSPTLTATFLAALLLVRAAGAQDAARSKEEISNSQAALSVCVAYLSILKECSTRNRRNPASADRAIADLKKRSDFAAKAMGMSSADVALRLKLNLAKQRHFVKTCSQIAILQSRYSEECNGLALGTNADFKR
jgi:hypothetical protein